MSYSYFIEIEQTTASLMPRQFFKFVIKMSEASLKFKLDFNFLFIGLQYLSWLTYTQFQDEKNQFQFSKLSEGWIFRGWGGPQRPHKMGPQCPPVMISQRKNSPSTHLETEMPILRTLKQPIICRILFSPTPYSLRYGENIKNPNEYVIKSFNMLCV